MIDGKTVLCEVGVGPPSMAFGLLVMQQPNVHVMLFEPNRAYAQELRSAIAGKTNVELHEVAIGDENGEIEFFDEGTSSSMAGIASPSQQHKGAEAPRPSYKVPVRQISEFDHGQIDLLRLDTEGSEWFCIKHLVSRPRQIVVEIYNNLATYINPYLYEIQEWAEQNGYKLVSIRDSDFTYERSVDPLATLRQFKL